MLENSISVDIIGDVLDSRGVLVKNGVVVSIESIKEERHLVLFNSSSKREESILVEQLRGLSLALKMLTKN